MGDKDPSQASTKRQSAKSSPLDNTIVSDVSEATAPTVRADGTILQRMPDSTNDAFPELGIHDLALLDIIGTGGMGKVFRGRQSYLEREVAVKVLQASRLAPSEAQEFRDRFKREAKILAGLSHPNIVSCHDAGISPNNEAYLIMEFIDGPDARDYVSDHGQLSEKQSLRICLELCEALNYAHKSNIIHRDVKPENVLLSHSAHTDDKLPFTAKLVDLGLARPQSASGDEQLTAAGVLLGTPATMAPEQFDDPDNVDFRADIYGLGCVLVYLLTGKPAFSGNSLSALLIAKTSGDLPQLSSYRPDLSGKCKQLIHTLLAPEAHKRPQSYDALRTALRNVRDAAANGGAVQAKGSKRGLVIVATLVVLAAVGFGIATSLKQPSAGDTDRSGTATSDASTQTANSASTALEATGGSNPETPHPELQHKPEDANTDPEPADTEAQTTATATVLAAVKTERTISFGRLSDPLPGWSRGVKSTWGLNRAW